MTKTLVGHGSYQRIRRKQTSSQINCRLLLLMSMVFFRIEYFLWEFTRLFRGLSMATRTLKFSRWRGLATFLNYYIDFYLIHHPPVVWMALVFSTVTVAITPSYSVSASHREIFAWVSKGPLSEYWGGGWNVKGAIAHFQPAALTWGSCIPFPLLFFFFPDSYAANQLVSWQGTSCSDFYSLPCH